MRIDINQKKIAIGDKYQVFIDGQPANKASNELFRLLSVINLFRNDDIRARLTSGEGVRPILETETNI